MCSKQDRPGPLKLVQRVLPRKGGLSVFYPLDIFKTDSDGSVLWRGAEENLVAAKRRIEQLSLSAPGDYLVLNQYTGRQVLITQFRKDANETCTEPIGVAF